MVARLWLDHEANLSLIKYGSWGLVFLERDQGSGISDRLIPDPALGSGFYQTEHISHLRIQFSSNCWHIWDTSGSYYELGCTSSANSQQYVTDGAGVKQTYEWNLDRLVAPYESRTQVRLMLVSYVQEKTFSNTIVRESQIKQITYGSATSPSSTSLSTIAGTIDFHYRGPSAQSPWVDAYSSSYLNNCGLPSGVTTDYRCDDPVDYSGGAGRPMVMSTYTLDSVTSYVGDDSSASHKAYSYAFSYHDTFDTYVCYDAYAQIPQYCAGNHQLTAVVPSIYQNGTAHAQKGLSLKYTDPLQDLYRDPDHLSTNPDYPYGGQTFWTYLSRYIDLDTGVGQSVTYETAYANTHGTPYVINADGSVDDRHNPLYCSRHANDSNTSKRCSGVYAHPEDKAWSTQVVTQTQALGTASATWWNTKATTTYNYWLATTGTGCNPITGSGVPTTPNQTDCVGDNWIPGYNGSSQSDHDDDWLDYDHAEFRGFKGVFIVNPAGYLTADYYFSTDGWFTPQSNGGNYNRGQLYEEDVYWGSTIDPYTLERKTHNYYPGVTGPFSSINSCNGNLNPTYNPCVLGALRTVVTYTDMSTNSSAPWTQVDYTYDDVNPTSGYVYGAHYHNLLVNTLRSEWI